MKSFDLKEKDLQFLINHLSSPGLKDILIKSMDDGHVRAKGQYPTGRFIIDLARGDVEALLDELTQLFTEIGLGENDEPNAIGVQIEGLIDIFNS